jgi:hypothetical protein
MLRALAGMIWLRAIFDWLEKYGRSERMLTVWGAGEHFAGVAVAEYTSV